MFFVLYVLFLVNAWQRDVPYTQVCYQLQLIELKATSTYM